MYNTAVTQYSSTQMLGPHVIHFLFQTFKHLIRGKMTDSSIPNSVYLHSYLTYMRLTKTIERNLIMIEMMESNLPENKPNPNKKITKPQDLARLYDIITQVKW